MGMWVPTEGQGHVGMCGMTMWAARVSPGAQAGVIQSDGINSGPQAGVIQSDGINSGTQAGDIQSDAIHFHCEVENKSALASKRGRSVRCACMCTWVCMHMCAHVETRVKLGCHSSGDIYLYFFSRQDVRVSIAAGKTP